MDKNRRHDKQAGVGVGGRLRQRLAQMLLRTSCAAATTSATPFVGLAATTAASRRRQPAPPQARPRGAHTHEPRSSMAAVADVGSSSCQRRRRDARRALVHISIDCSAARSSVAAAAAVLQHSAPTLRSKGKGGGRGRSRLPPRAPPYGYGWSWSSSSSARDTDGVAAPFSSDGEREEEGAAHTAGTSTLFSSRSLSFSSDSASDLYGGTTDNHGGGGGTRPRRRKKKPPSPPPRRAPSRARPAADADSFRPLVGEHRGKKKEEEEERRPGDGRSRCGCGSAMAASAAAGSTAVVKRSHNPYADFRSSMAEMVAGRRIRGADALSELLVWYLSLNSPRHHPAILAAFEDVWEAVLGSGEP